jgi:hypothetical protein
MPFDSRMLLGGSGELSGTDLLILTPPAGVHALAGLPCLQQVSGQRAADRADPYRIASSTGGRGLACHQDHEADPASSRARTVDRGGEDGKVSRHEAAIEAWEAPKRGLGVVPNRCKSLI